LEHRASNPVSVKNLKATETELQLKVVEALYSSENEED
jgi:hypothetical protein